MVISMTGCFSFLAKQKINTKLDTLASGMENENTDQIVSTLASNYDKSKQKQNFNDYFQYLSVGEYSYQTYEITNRTIAVNGEQATADVTISFTMNTGYSNSGNSTLELKKEAGEWVFSDISQLWVFEYTYQSTTGSQFSKVQQ